MFTEVVAEDLLREVRSHDFAADPAHECGARQIDAIVALDRVIRAAQAEQLARIAAVHAERVAVMGIGRGDPTLSVIGEVAMARNIGWPRPAPRSGRRWVCSGCLGSASCSRPDRSANRWSGRW